MIIRWLRLLPCLGLVWLAGASVASGQQADRQAGSALSVADRAELEALEPAVDVGESMPAGQPRQPEPAPESTVSRATESLDLETTSITGTQALPKVLYIVPWKSSDLGDLVGRPVGTLIDEVLAPVDPEVFQRHLAYYDALYGEGQEE
jgi:hypothetical protein